MIFNYIVVYIVIYYAMFGIYWSMDRLNNWWVLYYSSFFIKYLAMYICVSINNIMGTQKYVCRISAQLHYVTMLWPAYHTPPWPDVSLSWVPFLRPMDSLPPTAPAACGWTLKWLASQNQDRQWDPQVFSPKILELVIVSANFWSVNIRFSMINIPLAEPAMAIRFEASNARHWESFWRHQSISPPGGDLSVGNMGSTRLRQRCSGKS